MNNISEIEENLVHEVSEVICLKCLHRWIDVYPQATALKELECKCGAVGYVIKTGQTFEDADDECDKCLHCKDGKCSLGLHSSKEIYCEYYKGEDK